MKINQETRKAISNFCIRLAFAIGITVLIFSPFIPNEESSAEQNNDFDDQEKINRNGNIYDIENDSIIEGEPIKIKTDNSWSKDK